MFGQSKLQANRVKKTYLLTMMGCLLIQLSSCSSSPISDKQKAMHTIHISDAQPETFFPEKCYDTSKIVALETSEDCLLSTIYKVYLTENYIIVIELKNGYIQLFDTEGKYVRKIGKKGEGPEEYNELNDIVYDNKKMAQCRNHKEYDAVMYQKPHRGFIDQVNIWNDRVFFVFRESKENRSSRVYQVKANTGNNQFKVYNGSSGNALPASFNELLYITETGEELYAIYPQRLWTGAFNRLKEQMPEICEDDNPILVFCNLNNQPQ